MSEKYGAIVECPYCETENKFILSKDDKDNTTIEKFVETCEDLQIVNLTYTKEHGMMVNPVFEPNLDVEIVGMEEIEK